MISSFGLLLAIFQFPRKYYCWSPVNELKFKEYYFAKDVPVRNYEVDLSNCIIQGKSITFESKISYEKVLQLLSSLKPHLTELIVEEVELSAKYPEFMKVGLDFLDSATAESVLLYESTNCTMWASFSLKINILGGDGGWLSMGNLKSENMYVFWI